jgi:hypothetical protein
MLNWDSTGIRRYETGVDRGVLYVPGLTPVVWPGLISVNQTSPGGEAKAYFIDGVKYLHMRESTEFAATIEAFSAPREFAVCDGNYNQNGLIYTEQPRKPFGLSYRTRVGTDSNPDAGYKIHIVYGCLAGPSSRDFSTVSDTPTPAKLSWDIATRAPTQSNWFQASAKPTAHLVVDSLQTRADILAEVEGRLYGADAYGGVPTLIQPLDFYVIFNR